MARIFVTRKIPEKGILLLKEVGHEVVVSEKDGVLTKDELIAALTSSSYDALLSLLTDTVDAEVFDSAPSLKIVANYAAGIDNIDLDAAKMRGITVTNTPDALTDAVAEFTFALILALAKRIPESERFLRAGNYKGWDPLLLLGSRVSQKTLGLVGAGRIGKRVAEYAHMFGMYVSYYDIERNPDLEKGGAVFSPTLETLIEGADFVSLHVPLLTSTRHLIDGRILSKMKSSAFLINTARGPVVDEEALLIALQQNTIAGAALDVFEHEPKLTPGLADLENIIVTPHIASATHEARNAMSETAARNILAVLNGQMPPNEVHR